VVSGVSGGFETNLKVGRDWDWDWDWTANLKVGRDCEVGRDCGTACVCGTVRKVGRDCGLDCAMWVGTADCGLQTNLKVGRVKK